MATSNEQGVCGLYTKRSSPSRTRSLYGAESVNSEVISVTPNLRVGYRNTECNSVSQADQYIEDVTGFGSPIAGNRFIDTTGGLVFTSYADSSAIPGTFNGTSDYHIAIGDYRFGTSLFTFEAFYTPNNSPRQNRVLFYIPRALGGFPSLLVQLNNGSDLIQVFNGHAGGAWSHYFDCPFNPSVQNHFAYVRYGTGENDYTMYSNGTRTSSSNYSSGVNTYNSAANTMFVGSELGTTRFYKGVIDQFRITVDQARYTGASHTVPSYPFTSY